VPAGNSLAAELLLRLGDLVGSEEDVRRGAWVLESLGEPLARYPIAFGYALGAAELAVHGATEVAIVGVQGEARDSNPSCVKRRTAICRRSCSLPELGAERAPTEGAKRCH
jgi:Highly conserved protein containing a thioredoxin domain